MASLTPHHDQLPSSGRPPIQPFRLMKLPPELRENVYFFALPPKQPLDITSIRNVPEFVTVPIIAQLSQQVRQEALALFLRDHNPVGISLHGNKSFERAMTWVTKHTGLTPFFSRIIFTGRIREAHNEFFRIELHCSTKYPHFQATVGEAASHVSNAISSYIKHRLLKYLETLTVNAEAGSKGKLSSEQLFTAIVMVDSASQMRNVLEVIRDRERGYDALEYAYL